MRSLVSIIFLIYVSLASASNTYINNTKIDKVSYVLQSQKFETKQNSPENDVPSLRQNISFNMQVGDQFNVETTVISAKTDYKNVQLTDNKGQTHSLAQDYDRAEHSLSVNGQYYSGANNYSLGIVRSMNSSPYFNQGVQAGYYYRGLYDSYKLGSDVSVNQNNQPESYYTNRQFTLQKRPSSLITNKMTVWYEQVLNEDLKTRLEFLYGQRPADRPNNNGMNLKIGYVLSSNYFLRTGVGYISEENTDLKNERGSFSTRYFDSELIYKPSYRFLISFAYGLIVESEKSAFVGEDQTFGHDVYTVDGKYKFPGYTISSTLSFRQSNTDSQEANLSGGFIWEM